LSRPPCEDRFTAAQAELYEAVLEVQLACLSMCAPGVSLDHVYSSMLALLGRQLKRLGVVKASASDVDVLKVLYLTHYRMCLTPDRRLS